MTLYNLCPLENRPRCEGSRRAVNPDKSGCNFYSHLPVRTKHAERANVQELERIVTGAR